MNSKHYKKQQFEKSKVFKSVFGPLVKLEIVDEEEISIPLTQWQKIKKWFCELPIWSIK